VKSSNGEKGGEDLFLGKGCVNLIEGLGKKKKKTL